MNENLTPIGSLPPGAALRRLRLERGLTLRALAERAGTSPSALHRYENGWDRFELRTLRRLAEALEARLVVTLEPIDRTVPPPRTDRELVELLRPLFWDVDLEVQHLSENAAWVIRRVLEYGDRDAVTAVRHRFGDAAVFEASRHRSVDPKTRRFWDVVLASPGRSR